VIRIAPPLVIQREDLDWGLDQIERALEGSFRSEEGAFSQVA